VQLKGIGSWQCGLKISFHKGKQVFKLQEKKFGWCRLFVSFQNAKATPETRSGSHPLCRVHFAP
jgi:hypothetical protein